MGRKSRLGEDFLSGSLLGWEKWSRSARSCVTISPTEGPAVARRYYWQGPTEDPGRGTEATGRGTERLGRGTECAAEPPTCAGGKVASRGFVGGDFFH